MTPIGNRPCAEMLAQLPDVLFRYRFIPSPACEYVNDAITRMTGYTPDEVYADSDFARRLVHPDDRRALREGVRNARMGNPMPTATMRWVCKDGRVIWTEQRNVAVFDERGRLLAVEGVVRDVTDRVATAEALRASDARLQQLLEESPAIIYTHAPGDQEPARLSWISPNVEALLGYSPEQLTIDGAWPPLVHIDDMDRVRQGIAELRATGVADADYRFRHADGSWRWLHDHARLTRDSSGAALVIGCWLDVTRRREVEQTLQVREAQYAAMIEHGSDVITTLTRDGIVTYESPSGAAVFGYTPDDVVGTCAFDRVHPDDLARVKATFAAALLHESGGRAEYRYRHKNGTWVYVESHGRPFRDDDGAVESAIVSTRDIGERRQAEQALAEAHAFGKAIEDAMRAGLLVQDRAGRITYVNPGFVSMFGWSAEELLGRTPPFPYWPPEAVDAMMPIFRRVVIDGHLPSAPVETRYMRRSGERVDVEIVVSPLETAQGAMTLVAMYDVTERKRLEAEYRQAQKLEAIGRLAGGVAHDFNNLLTAIIGYADMGLEQIAESDPLRDDLLEIRNAGERAAALTRQLLAFSRNQVLRPELIDLNIVIDGLTRMLGRLIGEDVDLQSALEGELPSIRIDRGQVEQVLMNLVVNARDAMPAGGTLVIRTARVRQRTGRAVASGELGPGEYVSLGVTDTGCGMTPDVLRHLFEPFFTTKGVGKGTGLGLATVYGVVKQSGGAIDVVTAPGCGTTLLVYFPVAAAEETIGARTAADMPQQHRGRGEAILLVDDDPGILKLGSAALTAGGYKVTTARSGQEALALAHDAIALLISDVVMPAMNGPTLAQRLVGRVPGLRCLFMSGYTGQAFEPGFSHEILQKPFTPAQLLASVRGALDRPRALAG